MTLTKGLIRADIIAAKQAIDYYDEHAVKSMKNVAAYHLQQAAEKLIKFQIYSSGAEINHSQLYTHNIERLILYCETLEIDCSIPGYIRDKSLLLTDWEAGSRYDPDFHILGVVVELHARL